MRKMPRKKAQKEITGVSGATSPQRRVISPNSLANLRPWKPGQSGNPSGMAPMPFDLKKRLLEAVPTIIERMVEQAASSADDSATVEVRKYLLNRLYGTPEVQSKMVLEQQGADFGQVIGKLLGIGVVAQQAEQEETAGPEGPVQ